MKFGIPAESIKLILDEIKSHLGSSIGARLYIYGSRVKGNYRQYSDIDILLKADNYDENELSKIDFSELDIPYKVDFVLDRDLYEPYKEEIYSHMVEILE